MIGGERVVEVLVANGALRMRRPGRGDSDNGKEWFFELDEALYVLYVRTTSMCADAAFARRCPDARLLPAGLFEGCSSCTGCVFVGN